MDGTAAFAPLSEIELQERMALESIDGPIGGRRDDILAGCIIQATQIGPLKTPQSIAEIVRPWDREEAEQQDNERLRAKLKSRDTG